MKIALLFLILIVPALSYAQESPEVAPDAAFLNSFAKRPLSSRIQAYQRMHGITQRDFGEMSPSDQQSIRCMIVAEKIDIQRSYQRAGSHGVFNMDSLLRAGPKSCGPFLQQIADATN